MIIRYLAQLRQKPRPVRNRYAMIYASGFTVVVTLVWFVSGAAVRLSPDSELQQSSVGIFSGLMNEVRGQWATVVQSLATSSVGAEKSPPTEGPPQTSALPVINLSPEDIEIARQRSAEVARTEVVETEASNQPVYEEVLIIPASERFPDQPPPN